MRVHSIFFCFGTVLLGTELRWWWWWGFLELLSHALFHLGVWFSYLLTNQVFYCIKVRYCTWNIPESNKSVCVHESTWSHNKKKTGNIWITIYFLDGDCDVETNPDVNSFPCAVMFLPLVFTEDYSGVINDAGARSGVCPEVWKRATLSAAALEPAWEMDVM